MVGKELEIDVLFLLLEVAMSGTPKAPNYGPRFAILTSKM